MNRNKIENIRKEFLKRKLYTKNEVKRIILKSIIRNFAVKPLVRIKAAKLNQKKSKFHYISKQKNNICIKTGRIKGVYNYYSLSRHYLKFLGNSNNLQNVKIASW